MSKQRELFRDWTNWKPGKKCLYCNSEVKPDQRSIKGDDGTVYAHQKCAEFSADSEDRGE